jgi:hypothetical protein
MLSFFSVQSLLLTADMSASYGETTEDKNQDLS